jgi:monoamine oxidase
MYDVIIVGGGIAGLHCARQLLMAEPTKKILLLEKYNYIGGRVVTFRRNMGGRKYAWENGAGRIHKSHKLVGAYMKRYGLTFRPADSKTLLQLRDGAPVIPNPFNDAVPAIMGPLLFRPAADLASKTVKQILAETYGHKRTKEFLSLFPYRSEVDTLRADVALRGFLGPASLQGDGYGTCAEGLSTLIERLADEVTGMGATILFGHSVQSFSGTTLTVKAGDTKKTFEAEKIIFATHAAALRSIGGIATWPLLKQVAMRPLTRIYAVFSTAWFGQERIVFANNPLRYMIPVGPNTVMVSYTDGNDTHYWSKMPEEKIAKPLMAALRRAFPHTYIPEPTFVKVHHWYEGCSYWLPTQKYISPETLSVMATNPFPNIYVCGESFSTNQAWMEGALEHAELLLRLHFHTAPNPSTK